MEVVLFSKSGIQFEAQGKGDIVALYVPIRSDVRNYSDIPNINRATVKERYGDLDLNPLYRVFSDVVTVYGTLPMELAERRQSIDAFLPQDYTPSHCDVFYYVFGERWLVHGKKEITDDGREVWGISMIDAEAQGMEKLLSGAISDRLFEGSSDTICVAAHCEQTLFQKYQDLLEPLGVNLVRFDSLSRHKETQALYSHRDYGLGMLVTGMLAFLVLAGSLAFLTVKSVQLQAAETDIDNLIKRIAQQEQSRVLGEISEPNKVLSQMKKPMIQQPSSILHATADVGAVFGTLEDVMFRLDKNAISAETIEVNIKAKTSDAELLVDQEQVAKSALSTRPWIRSIERIPGGTTSVDLKIMMQVK